MQVPHDDTAPRLADVQQRFSLPPLHSSCALAPLPRPAAPRSVGVQRRSSPPHPLSSCAVAPLLLPVAQLQPQDAVVAPHHLRLDVVLPLPLVVAGPTALAPLLPP